MKTLRIETKLNDFELEEALEKSLKGVRVKIQKHREFDDPAQQTVFALTEKAFEKLLSSMTSEIERVLSETVE